MAKNSEQFFIHPRQLRVGIYVHLDLSWMQHPFPLSHFKIKDEAQIRTIQALGLKQVRYDPVRSDCEPLPLSGEVPEPQPIPTVTQDTEPVKAEPRKARVKRLPEIFHFAVRQLTRIDDCFFERLKEFFAQDFDLRIVGRFADREICANLFAAFRAADEVFKHDQIFGAFKIFLFRIRKSVGDAMQTFVGRKSWGSRKWRRRP